MVDFTHTHDWWFIGGAFAVGFMAGMTFTLHLVWRSLCRSFEW